MGALKTLKQRAVLRRRPRAFPIGTTRQWQGGTYVKTGPRSWQRQSRPAGKAAASFAGILASLPPAAAKDSGGLAGLTRALAAADSSQAAEARALAGLALTALSQRPGQLAIPLAGAFSVIMTVGADDMTWELYCARRLATFNDGMVDLSLLPGYVQAAKAHHDDELPEMRLAKGYTGPRTVADINLASWTAFYAEGGNLNQPVWLETNRLKELRRQFELLANLHRG